MAEAGGGEGAAGDVRRRLAGDDRQGVYLGLLGQDRQLLHGGGPPHVQRRHHDLLALGLVQAQRQLAHRGGLARALQARDHDHHRRIGLQVDVLGLVAAQHIHQAVEHDLDHLVGGLDRADDVLAGGAFLGLGDEVPDHRQGDVGLEQRHAHFAQGFVDVLLRQHAPAGQPVEYARQPFTKGLEHSPFSSHPHNATSPRARSRGRGASPPSSRELWRGSWRSRAQVELRRRAGLMRPQADQIKFGPLSGRQAGTWNREGRGEDAEIAEPSAHSSRPLRTPRFP